MVYVQNIGVVARMEKRAFTLIFISLFNFISCDIETI